MSSNAGLSPLNVGDYSPGVCNIGPAEIARRRMAGHIGLLVSAAVLAGLVAVGAPHWTRLILVLPAGGSASGYLQAWFHFCAGFGSRGIYNFGSLGTVQDVADPEARALDRAKSLRIGVGSLAIGAGVAIVAALLPI
ncbi:MAG: hypothetical protein ABSD62_02500 [Candidatus Limnocylindrales bacterium]|jgi:hypothetical protein